MSETFQNFADRIGLKMDVANVEYRPDSPDHRSMSEQRWNREAFHYKLTFRIGRKSEEFFYSMGAGHGVKVAAGTMTQKERSDFFHFKGYFPVDSIAKDFIIRRPKPGPTLPDVLESLQLDA